MFVCGGGGGGGGEGVGVRACVCGSGCAHTILEKIHKRRT